MVWIVAGMLFCSFLVGVVLMALLAVSKDRGPEPGRKNENRTGAVWHLTQRGWISEREAFSLREPDGIPSDRVLSCAFEEGEVVPLQGRPVVFWRSPDEGRVRELINRFGEIPPQENYYPAMLDPREQATEPRPL